MVIIDFSGGGSVRHFEERVDETIRTRQQVVINGECYSACTLYLRNPRTCVTKNAKLGFHAARDITPERPIDVEATRRIYHEMPPGVTRYIEAHGGYDGRWIVLEGPRLWALVRLCPMQLPKPEPRRPDIVTGMMEPVSPWTPDQDNADADIRTTPH